MQLTSTNRSRAYSKNIKLFFLVLNAKLNLRLASKNMQFSSFVKTGFCIKTFKFDNSYESISYTILGDDREKVHLFPFRTQKLSFSSPTILGWKRPGKIGHCQDTCKQQAIACCFFYNIIRNNHGIIRGNSHKRIKKDIVVFITTYIVYQIINKISIKNCLQVCKFFLK